MLSLDHKHIIINAAVKKPFMKVKETKTWLCELVEKVNMEIVVGPFAKYCKSDDNEGITGVVSIATSHASIHCWDKKDPPIVRFDLYSCDTFDKNVVLKHMEVFDPYFLDWVLIDRNKTVMILDQGYETLEKLK
jgi:S-adenosylmethionine/arginine decarboxylase-like enzyme